MKIVIIGGGASGFFTAINLKEKNPELDITILEKSKEVLHKVKISGGGRCNLTNACFEPSELVKFYPRGTKELLGAFHKFMTGDAYEWFEEHGVALKIEDDLRVFPQSDSSQTVIDCFLSLAKKYQIEIIKSCGVEDFHLKASKWIIETKTKVFQADKLIIASGSNKHIWSIAKKRGHTIIKPVPSLFTFNIKDNPLKDLAGVSLPNATLEIVGEKLEQSGALLITHWGLSGPAVLKLSAFGARILAEKSYDYQVKVNWLSISFDEMLTRLSELKKENPKKQIGVKSPFVDLPKRLWERLLTISGIDIKQNWADLSKKQLYKLAEVLTQCKLQANGKSTFKEEFVTAGGIALKEINFKTFESKVLKNLHFVGEVLDIDALTGGFNFQNAWTNSYLCASAISDEVNSLK